MRHNKQMRQAPFFEHLKISVMGSALKFTIVLLCILSLLTLITPGVIAQAVKVKAHKMTVTGSSTLHEWESEITKAEFKGDVKTENLQLKEIKSFEAKILVEGIKSTKGKTMDNKTYEAFNYTKFPYIVFTLSSTTVNANGTIDAKGTLSMAGYSKPIELQAKYKMLSNGDVQITISKKIKMSEWKMEPPTAVMGTIKVGDDVTVNFDLVVNNRPNQ
jgi:polyisoprenoid-binding protein YceI